MPSINTFSSMGGLSPASMYQDLSANRRQSQPLPEAADNTSQATQQEATAAATRTSLPQQAPAPAQPSALPTVESLDNASTALSQMRVQFSDPADAAFERFQAENNARMQEIGQMPPPPPPRDNAAFERGLERIQPPEAEGGEPPVQDAGQMPSPPANEETPAGGMSQMQPPTENRQSMQAASQMTPPPANESLPAQIPDEQAEEGTAAPLAAVTSGVV